jgi:hypothetical protein
MPWQKIPGRKPKTVCFSLDIEVKSLFEQICAERKLAANLELEKLMERFIEEYGEEHERKVSPKK